MGVNPSSPRGKDPRGAAASAANHNSPPAAAAQAGRGRRREAVADFQGASFIPLPSQALGDRNREPGRLYDLEYESDDEAEEEKVIQNPSKPR